MVCEATTFHQSDLVSRTVLTPIFLIPELLILRPSKNLIVGVGTYENQSPKSDALYDRKHRTCLHTVLNGALTAQQCLLLKSLCLRYLSALRLEGLRLLVLLHTLGLQGLAADERPYCRLHLAGHTIRGTATLAIVEMIGGCKVGITAKVLIRAHILPSL